ncbi:hypothetical protein KP509_32G006700 [Ceratopteris richardii]|uniref:RING-type domain-containing protein n=1 Tax=Ceratopteris richardii TaxID=49495 RepID=A0A8T2QRD5_CERRI|nr:hypothetical protein KP509_32G006700 [Ceratopteris richardii]
MVYVYTVLVRNDEEEDEDFDIESQDVGSSDSASERSMESYGEEVASTLLYSAEIDKLPVVEFAAAKKARFFCPDEMQVDDRNIESDYTVIELKGDKADILILSDDGNRIRRVQDFNKPSSTVDDPDHTCGICLEDLQREDKVFIFPNCDHLFHVACARPWLSTNTSCPFCRKKVLDAALHSNGFTILTMDYEALTENSRDDDFDDEQMYELVMLNGGTYIP